MGYATYELDEERPFALDGWTLEVVVYGEATIKYRWPGDWWLDELAIDASKGARGSCEATRRMIDKESPLFLAVADYLSRERAENIEELICADQRAQYESAQFDAGKERAKFQAVTP